MTVGKSQEALQLYDKAIKLDRQLLSAYVNKGNTYQNLKEYHKAIEMYDQVLQLDDQYGQAYINKGFTLKLL